MKLSKTDNYKHDLVIGYFKIIRTVGFVQKFLRFTTNKPYESYERAEWEGKKFMRETRKLLLTKKP